MAHGTAWWVWVVFGYAALCFIFVSAVHAIRYGIKKRPESFFLTLMPGGWALSNLVMLGVIPRIFAVPFLLASAVVGTFLVIATFDLLRRGRAGP